MGELVLVLLMFWNVENYFDPFNNPLKDDDEFTPRGAKYWSWKRFEKKRDDISKTIMLVNEEIGVFPAIIGLCEVENYLCLKQLTQNTPLAKVGYKFIIGNSQDKRGINTALLYNPKMFKVLITNNHRLTIEGKPNFKTRDQLVVTGLLGGDKISFIVNHWPSRLG